MWLRPDDLARKSLDGCYVYVLWGRRRITPVYVGQSVQVIHRLRQHMSERQKRELTVKIQLIRCRDVEEMCRLEEQMIARLHPYLNRLGNTDVLDFSGLQGPFDRPFRPDPPDPPARDLHARGTGGPTINVPRSRYEAVMKVFSRALG